ncbi:MAG: phospholipase A [Gammaproteobacteria bacterium]|nr:MAG: phospholipase A [Gammaproteobacteria bacterium]
MSSNVRMVRLGALWTGLLLAGLMATPAAAVDTSDCVAIPADGERLACYDRAHGRRPAAAAPEAAAPETTTPVVAAPRRSLLEDAWGFAPDSGRYLLRYHYTNYLLPARYSNDPNEEPYRPGLDLAPEGAEVDSLEAKFQLSFRSRLWVTDDRRLGVWAAYTQQSHWQVYNGDLSRPFRETNYMPELFASYDPDLQFGSFDWGVLNIGYNHQSNGRTQLLSRSWDRLFAEVGVENGNFALLARAWHRISESDSDDDNPDITDYLGYGQLTALYRWRDHSFTLTGRGNWNTNKGSIEATYLSSPLIGPLRGYLLLFSGYGESMIDYNWNQTVIGAGIAINSQL